MGKKDNSQDFSLKITSDNKTDKANIIVNDNHDAHFHDPLIFRPPPPHPRTLSQLNTLYPSSHFTGIYIPPPPPPIAYSQSNTSTPKVFRNYPLVDNTNNKSFEDTRKKAQLQDQYNVTVNRNIIKSSIQNLKQRNCPLEGSTLRRLAESMQFNEYPPGIVNPAFTDMFLWELRTGHPCNHYMIPRESNIRKGLVFRGNAVYVYTPIFE